MSIGPMLNEDDPIFGDEVKGIRTGGWLEGYSAAEKRANIFRDLLLEYRSQHNFKRGCSIYDEDSRCDLCRRVDLALEEK